MDPTSNNKMLKNQESDGGVDRISDLPDPILCHILNHLSTKNAVATNVLSNRWKNLFPFEASPVYLAFDDTDFIVRPVQNESHCLASFESFMDKVLLQTLSYNPPVGAMLLHCHKFHGDAKIASWINAALRLNVPHLLLMFSDEEHQGTLFTCLNGYTRLVTLHLNMGADLCLPDNFSLPNLKALELTNLRFDYLEGDSINKLLDGCPRVVDLSLIDSSFYLEDEISIRSDILRCLTIKDSTDYAKYHLALDTPLLQSLHFSCFAARKYSLYVFEYLYEARIDIGPEKDLVDDLEGYDNVYSDGDENTWFVDAGTALLVHACCNTWCLELSARAIDDYMEICENQLPIAYYVDIIYDEESALHNSSVQVPPFPYLTKLWLGSLGNHGWALLARLLLNAPYLTELYFKQGFNGSEGDYEDFQSLVPIPPACVETQIRKIEFLVFDWSIGEVKLLVYFLVCCKLLQKVRLCVHPSWLVVQDKLPPQVVLESR